MNHDPLERQYARATAKLRCVLNRMEGFGCPQAAPEEQRALLERATRLSDRVEAILMLMRRRDMERKERAPRWRAFHY